MMHPAVCFMCGKKKRRKGEKQTRIAMFSFLTQRGILEKLQTASNESESLCWIVSNNSRSYHITAFSSESNGHFHSQNALNLKVSKVLSSLPRTVFAMHIFSTCYMCLDCFRNKSLSETVNASASSQVLNVYCYKSNTFVL